MIRLAAFAFVLTLAACTAAPARDKAKVKVVPQHVVLVEGSRPVKVTKKDRVRIVQTAIAGAEIKARISGPGKIAGSAYVRRIKDGEPVLGTTIKEYTIKPTGPGTIRVTLTVHSPTGKDAQDHRYTIEVE